MIRQKRIPRWCSDHKGADRWVRPGYYKELQPTRWQQRVDQMLKEDAAAGKKRTTPWWRTVRDNGKLIDKFPGGGELQAKRLKAEGFRILPGKGKQPGKVAGFEGRAAK